jgi:thiol-disulfide isomerase/thioredoxin
MKHLWLRILAGQSHLVLAALLGLSLVPFASTAAVVSLGDRAENSQAERSGHIIPELLVGDMRPQQLFDAHPRFAEGYDAFEAESLAVPENVSVLLFFGTWCHDSEREVPRLLKLLETAGLSEDKLKLIALDYRKREPEGRATKFNVRYTPTAIFMRDGKEVGRIVERPEISLRDDITAMFIEGS